jgi:hypothetical protein
MAFSVYNVDVYGWMFEQRPEVVQVLESSRSEVQNSPPKPVSLVHVYNTKGTLLRVFANTGAENREGLACGI